MARELTLKYAGRLVKHLGLQMYSGAVPAIAELIANAWDAEAGRVDVTIPLGASLTEKSEIVVHDSGHGMSWNEADDEYLVVGRDRRATQGTTSKGGQRRLMARKGIGKLAGFGIAKVVEIRTVRKGHLTHFRMIYDDIVKDKDGSLVSEYKPEILADSKTSEPDGTTVRMTGITLTRAIPEDQFRSSLLRRFGVYSDTFDVRINGTPLRKDEMKFQFRFPEGKGNWNVETLSDGKEIKWWVGFAEEPIKDEEARGVTVLARGKLVQTPWLFGLSGGMHGQHGIQYMTGEVVADWLDDEEDLVATDRSSVMWEHPAAQPMQLWGQAKIKELVNKWAESRAVEKIKRLTKDNYLERIDRFPSRERAELKRAIQKLAEIPTITDDRLNELVEFLIRAYENEHFLELIRQLNAADSTSLESVLKLLAEWDVLEAIATAQIVRGRLEVIEKFAAMIASGAKEKPDLHEFLKKHPWLLNQGWNTVEHERSLDTVLARRFSGKGRGKKGGGARRVDYFVLGDASRAIVVELKRPGELASKEEIRQLMDYVDFLRQHEGQSSDPERPGRTVIHGYLVAGGVDPDAKSEQDRAFKDGVFVRTWKNLLDIARLENKHFFDVVKKRAPAEDPRIKALGDGVAQPLPKKTAKKSRPKARKKR